MTRKIKGFGNFEGFDVDAISVALRILPRGCRRGQSNRIREKARDRLQKVEGNYERGYPVRPREVAFMIHKTFQGMVDWNGFGSVPKPVCHLTIATRLIWQKSSTSSA